MYLCDQTVASVTCSAVWWKNIYVVHSDVFHVSDV
jgi:hypothetical protein